MGRIKNNNSKRLDLHGLYVDEAKRRIMSEIQRADNSITQLEIIHGSNNGTAILDMVRNQLRSPRISYISPSLLNPGMTTIYLKSKL